MAFLCRRYKVSRSGFYAWLAQAGSKRRRNDEELGARIERIHRDSGKRYGSPRVHEVLRREGVRCSNKRVARLMRERGLRARVSRLYRNSSGVHKFFLKTANLRLAEPLPTRTDQIWVGDLTYLRLGKRWRYLATVTDLFSRRIIGWTLARNRTTDVTLRALKRAISLRDPKPGLPFHSDRGIEYSAYGHQDCLHTRGTARTTPIWRASSIHSSPSSHTTEASPATPSSTPRSPATSIASTTPNASTPAWAIIPRSSSNAWPMPRKVSTEADEDHAFYSALRAARGAAKRGR